MSAGVSELKARLASVKQTRQITNAMYLLSASRLRKLMPGMDYALSYMKSLRSAMAGVLCASNIDGMHQRFIDIDSKGTALILSVMGDKGLCGGYNTAVADLTALEMKKHENAKLFCFGLVGRESLSSRGLVPDTVLPGSSMHPSLELARDLSETLIEEYVTDRFNEVYIIYTPFSHGEKTPVCMRLLPLVRSDFADVDSHLPAEEMLCEPSAEAVFEHMVPHYCTAMIYDMLIQSAACENAARTTAMKSAADNADEMIKQLQTELNASRQLRITNEITEIAAAKSRTEEQENELFG